MIGLIGLDYRLFNAEQRGRLSFSGERLAAALRALTASATLKEAVILSTCNRSEVYFAAHDGERAAETVKRLLMFAFTHGPAVDVEGFGVAANTVNLMPDELAHVLYDSTEQAAAEHLFGVAAGLRSMVIGEAQILGQVRDALVAAEAAGTVGDEMRALFTAAIKLGKRARAETGIGRADVSVASLAVKTATDSLGDLTGKTALIVGAGRTSQLCANLLRERGIGRLILANRSPSAARELADQVDGAPISIGELDSAISATDLVICATAAPHVILTSSMVQRGMAGRTEPLLIVDLAVPPDVADDVAQTPNVSLYTLDTLHSLSGANDLALGAPREHEVVQIGNMIAQSVQELARVRAVKLAVPTIAGLRRHVDQSEQAELARALGQLSHLSPQDREVIERFGQRLVDKMFHHLVSRIRSLAEYDEVPLDVTMRVLGQLFSDPTEEREAASPQPAPPARDQR